MAPRGGILFGAIYLHFTLITMPERVARYMAAGPNISLNGRALTFSIRDRACIAGVVSGFAPASKRCASTSSISSKQDRAPPPAPGRTRACRHIFAVAQISLAVALVIGAALMSKGMLWMLHLADVYEPAKMLTFNVTLA